MNGDSAPYAMDIVDAKAEVAVAKAIPDDLGSPLLHLSSSSQVLLGF